MIDHETMTDQQWWNSRVLRMCRPCPFPEWLMLELPNGKFAAFWKQGFDSVYCRLIAEGEYQGVISYQSRVKDRVLAHMAKHRESRD